VLTKPTTMNLLISTKTVLLRALSGSAIAGAQARISTGESGVIVGNSLRTSAFEPAEEKDLADGSGNDSTLNEPATKARRPHGVNDTGDGKKYQGTR
jgi:hypothetical protein